MKNQYVLLIGNPVDGVSIVGPFVDTENATEHAEARFKNSEWWIAVLEEVD